MGLRLTNEPAPEGVQPLVTLVCSMEHEGATNDAPGVKLSIPMAIYALPNYQLVGHMAPGVRFEGQKAINGAEIVIPALGHDIIVNHVAADLAAAVAFELKEKAAAQ